MEKFFQTLLSLFFPKRCAGCGRNGTYLCQSCTNQIYQSDLVCPMCERPALGGVTHPLCKRRYGLDGLWSLSIYQDPLRRVIQKLKYRWVRECAKDLVDLTLSYWIKHQPLLLDYVKKDKGFGWIVVPVPLHRKRQNWRGFNQSSLLAQDLAQRLGLDYQDCLARVKNTKPQMKLSAHERSSNIKGAFALKTNLTVKDKKIILVDDVWTTGSTLRECAFVLKRGGASKVWALTLAR